jgi:hypothetical protein
MLGIVEQLLLNNIQKVGVLFPMWAMHALNVQKFMDKIKFKPVEQYQAGLERVSQTHCFSHFFFWRAVAQLTHISKFP